MPADLSDCKDMRSAGLLRENFTEQDRLMFDIVSAKRGVFRFQMNVGKHYPVTCPSISLLEPVAPSRAGEVSGDSWWLRGYRWNCTWGLREIVVLLLSVVSPEDFATWGSTSRVRSDAARSHD
jgi:hypothetical protein